VVELDADLEADLGIDSIKKAQLFGELQEFFDIGGASATELSLDDFPTLRHVLNFLAASQQQPHAAIESTPAVANPPVAVSTPASQPAAASAAEPTSGVAAAELESFLVNFVVEQTGYPPEVVELDADLEADLGIDSIKKAQLFGELQEYFDIGGASATELSLDDFPTLRHVLNFLAANSAASENSPSGEESSSFSQAAPAPALEQIDRKIAPAAASGQPSLAQVAESEKVIASNGIAHTNGKSHSNGVAPANGNGKAHQQPSGNNVAALSGDEPVTVSGTPYELGWQHGSQFQAAIRRILRTYTEFVGQSLDELPGASDCAHAQQMLSADELDELQGIADAVGVPLANIVSHHFAISAAASEEAEFSAAIATSNDSGRLTHSVRYKSPLSEALREACQPVVLVRKPTRAIPHVAVVAIGTTRLLAGVNAAGVAIATDNGRTANSLSRSVLERAASLDAALELANRQMIRAAQTAQPWSATISDATADRLASVSCDGRAINVRSDEPEMFAAHQTSYHNRLSGALQGGLPTGSARATALLNPQSLGAEVEVGAGELWIEMEPASGTLRLRQGGSPRREKQFHYRHLLPAWTEESQRLAASSTIARGTNDALCPPRVTSRFVLDMQAAPLPPGAATEFTFTGAAIIEGDGETAAALEKLLRARQVVVHRLSPQADLAATLAEIERICSAGPAPHLFLTSARDLPTASVVNEAAFDAQRVAVMETPLFICQQWLALAAAGKWLDRCTLLATTAMCGDFGFAAGSSAPQGGAIAGLLKGIFIEYAFLQGFTELRVKVIDAPDEVPAEEIAASALRELASRDPDYEAAWNGSQRSVPRASQQPLADAKPALPNAKGASIRPGATWVVTGGARGITAACALELGRRYGLKLHLLGTTPLPTIDPTWRNLSDEGLQQLKTATILAARKAGQPAPAAWERVQKQIEMDRSFRAFETSGVAATYHVCDVGSRESLSKVLDAIRQQDGPIEGVLHGAGIDRSCRFEKKQRDVVGQTIRAKVDGAAHLMALLRRDPVRHFIGFGSISGRFGNFGQADYCLASEMLCKLIGAYRRERPWIQAVGIHWHGWDEVGMAARPEMKSLLQGKSDVELMPLAEGIGHLIREIEAGLPEREVIFTQKLHWERFASGMDVLLKHRGALAGESPAGSAYAKPVPPPAKQSATTPAASTTTASSQQPAQKTLAEAEPVELRTERYRLETVAAPLPTGSPAEPSFQHAVWILGENSVAAALKSRLKAKGVCVRQFAASGDLDELAAELTSAWKAQPASHLFLLTGRDEVPADLLSATEIERRRQQGIIAPYVVAQNFMKLLQTQPELGVGTIAAAVSLGGDFGFSGRAVLPEGGGVSGFLKSVYIENFRNEQSRVRCKAIDAPQHDSPERVADALLREIAASQPEVEVGWANGERSVIRPVAAPLSDVTSARIPRGGVWVITGGARGITAITAREMARRYGWKLHLLGTSPAPQADAAWRNYNEEQLKQLKTSIAKEALAAGKSPSEAWERVLKDIEIFKNMQQFTAFGAQAEYHQCDVTDGPAVARLLEKIRRQDGPITGLIHGAGLIAPCRFENNRRPPVEKLVRTKVDGLLNLLSALRNDPLTHCIGFGSISGRFGGNGLSDYAAGNDGMAKILDWYRAVRPACKSISFHWEQWEGAGIALIPRLAWGPRSVMNMKYMLPVEGVRRIEEELGAGAPAPEVLLTFGEYYPMFYPFEQTSPESSPPAATGVAAPMIGAARQTEEGWQGDVSLNPLTDPFLIQHRLRNKPLLPVVVGLEALAEAATLASGKRVVGFRDVEMADGLFFHTDRPVVARVTVPSIENELAEVRLTCDFLNRTGGLIQKDRLYLRAKAELAAVAKPLAVALPPLPTVWEPVPYPETSIMYHGAPFRCFEALSAIRTEGWAKLTALPLSGLVGSQRTAGWLLPSCVFDAAMFACGCHLWAHAERAVSLPKHIDRMQPGRLPRDGEACYVYFRNHEITGKTASYDFTIVGEDLGVILQVTGYHKVILMRESAP
jgi:NAD(P)-dependent dehydrogenase (short-subunit alcohol dehydrogenase family)/acyl carrier protein